ncbi:MAG: ORF6C domain-containing protein [Paeniclostridium sordellii]|nr:ORF6C domain-containing protein [Paeniclostridium sordellii]
MNNTVKVQNEELIRIESIDGQLLVSSKKVAEHFEKEHKHVLEKIDSKRRELNKSVENSADINSLKIFFLDNFLEDFYIDAKGREQRQVLLTKDGFSFITMGFTGLKADAWKLKYIEAFNKMEQELRENKQYQYKNLSPEMKALLTHDVKIQEMQKEVKTVREDLIDFKEDIPLFAVECDEITRLVRKTGTDVLNGKNSNAYRDKSLRSKVYSDIYRQLRREFGVRSYKAIKRRQLDKALKAVENYKLPTCLIEEINLINKYDNRRDLVC